MKQITLTKKDVKEVVVEALTPLVKAVKKDFDRIDKRFKQVDKRFDVVDRRFNGVDVHLTNLEHDMREVKSDIAEMKKNSSELFTKLDRFIKLYEDQKAETKLLSEHVQRLEERLLRLEKQLNLNH